MRKFIGAVFLLMAISFLALAKHNEAAMKAEDSYIRDRVVMLEGKLGSCSGIEITANSGKHYILSAAHCTEISNNGKMEAIRENGSKFNPSIIKVDRVHDLLIMTSEDATGIRVGEHIYRHQHVRTLTHGGGMPTYRTDGEVLDEQEIKVMAFIIQSQQDEIRCKSVETRKVIPGFFIFPPYCEAKMKEVAVTAKIVPGSSGGPVLNDAGELIGIVSSSGGDFGYMVPLHDVKAFLRGM